MVVTYGRRSAEQSRRERGRRPSPNGSSNRHQFAGGSLAGNDCAPHSSTRSHTRDHGASPACPEDAPTGGRGERPARTSSGNGPRSAALGEHESSSVGGETGSAERVGARLMAGSLPSGPLERRLNGVERRSVSPARRALTHSDWPVADCSDSEGFGEHPRVWLPALGNGLDVVGGRRKVRHRSSRRGSPLAGATGRSRTGNSVRATRATCLERGGPQREPMDGRLPASGKKAWSTSR